MLSAFAGALVFCLIVAGVAVPVAATLRIEGCAARISVALAAALTALYLGAFIVYAAGLNWYVLLLLPLAAGFWTWRIRDRVRTLAADPNLPLVLGSWVLVALGTTGCHALVLNYSGGGWAGDWYEHYERALFFLRQLPPGTKFLDLYELPARPPLANLVTAALLGIGSAHFAAYQVVSTLLASLVFFPLAALVERGANASRAIRLLALLLLLNPLFMHNAAYPWTKLPAAFFALTGTLLLWRSDQEPVLFAWSLVVFAAGLVTHYSVGPWLLAFAASGLWRVRTHWKSRSFLRAAGLGAVAATVLAGTWLAWSVHHYGAGATVQATSTVGWAPDVSAAARVAIALRNALHTLVPDADSPILAAMLEQKHDSFARLRDVAFCLYQQSLLVGLGLGNVLVATWLAVQRRRPSGAGFWIAGAILAVLLGSAAHSTPVDLGVAHICLQPLVLLGLTLIASIATELPRWLKTVWVAGLVIDFICGIALHFGFQSLAIQRFLAPDIPDRTLIWVSGSTDVVNYNAKLRVAEPFLGDFFAAGRLPLVIGLIVILLFAIRLTARTRTVAATAAPSPA